MSDGLTLEKMKVNERLGAIEAKLDLLIPEIQHSNKALTEIITGNGSPEKGLAFRVAQIESKEKGKEQNSTALWTFLSSLGIVVLGDIIKRYFFHK